MTTGSIRVNLLDGTEASIQVPIPDGSPSTYFFSMERSGSSLFWTISRKLLTNSGRSFCQPLEDLFPQGHTRRNISTETMRDLLKMPGYAFGMFREVDVAFTQLATDQNKKFVLIRDPRDVVVSLFFAMAGAHRVPESGNAREQIMEMRKLTQQPISDFVRSDKLEGIWYRYRQYADFVKSRPNVIVFRYEEVIFDKRAWVLKLVEELNLSISYSKAFSIADAHDQLPMEERIDQHIRQVKPGNFRRHLDPESIRYIETQLAAEMAFFGYVPEQSCGRPFQDQSFYIALARRIQGIEEQFYRYATELDKLRKLPLGPT